MEEWEEWRNTAMIHNAIAAKLDGKVVDGMEQIAGQQHRKYLRATNRSINVQDESVFHG